METKEVWKLVNIEGNNTYSVSTLGRFKNNKTQRIMKTSPNSKGYHQISLSINKKQKSYRVHRLVALTFLENPDNKPQVNHKDGIKSNNLLDNLEWATALENNVHAYDTGLNGVRYKLEQDKENIEDLIELGHSFATIARTYDCHEHTIRKFVKENYL